jgi:predicted DNA-binding transcriptional regulator YafY
LRRHQPLTAKQLAEKLMVSVRTIYRYVDDLSLSGIPIYGEPGNSSVIHSVTPY